MILYTQTEVLLKNDEFSGPILCKDSGCGYHEINDAVGLFRSHVSRSYFKVKLLTVTLDIYMASDRLNWTRP